MENACWEKVKRALLIHFLPIGLVVAILLGLTVPKAGQAVASVKIYGKGVFETVCVVTIFVISGLTLSTDDITAAMKAWNATLFGVISILFITPLMALVPQGLKFMPQEFRVGFLLFCTMPTTINSGVAIATAAKGNFALALLLTVLSNLLGIFTAPFYLSLLLSVDDVSMNPVPLLVDLLLTLLLPLTIGKACRECFARSLQPFLKRHKLLITNLSSFCLICLPWMKLSASQQALLSLSVGAVLGLIACGLVIHAIYLVFNFSAATVLRFPLDIKKSVVIMGSQKTLPMAMTVLSFFPDSLGQAGLIAIPCITSHLTQIFADTFLAAKWAHVTDAEAEQLSALPVVA